MIQLAEMPRGLRMKPTGWARTYLEKMLSGYTGNLDRLFYPFNTDCWLKGSFQDGGMEGWWPYEQAAYWLDGYVKCAYFAGAEDHYQKAKGMIDEALKIVDADGFVGATDLKEEGLGNQWVHAVFFRAVLFLYEVTGEARYLERVRDHYLSGTNQYDTWRESVNIENMAVCYLKCGDERLKELAVKAYAAHCQREDNVETKMSDYEKDTPIELHAVTYNEMLKIPILLYAITEEEKYLEAAKKGLDRIYRHHLLPTGIHSASEAFGGTSAISCVETCDITDFTWMLGYLAAVTGETEYLDRIERIMYNVAPSVMDPEFKSMQYYSSLNHVVCLRNSNHSGSFTQTPRTAYQANHYPECCTGNLNRSMPNFLYRALAKKGEEIRFQYYIPGEYEMEECQFTVDTEYPYRENVKIIYHGETKERCLRLRVPAWCEDFAWEYKAVALKSSVDPAAGEKAEKKIAREGGWLVIRGEFREGDAISLRLGSKIEVLPTEEGYLVQKQPMIYTLKIGAKVEKDLEEPRQTEEYPSYNITPVTEWAMALDPERFLAEAKLTGEKTDDLLTSNHEIQSVGYLLQGVGLKHIDVSEVPISDYDKGEIIKLRGMGQIIMEGEMVFTPDLSELVPDAVCEMPITLVPYASACLRWTIFPDVKRYQ